MNHAPHAPAAPFSCSLRTSADFLVYRIDSLDGSPLFIGKVRGRLCRRSHRQGPAITASIAAGLTRDPVIVAAHLTEAEAYALQRALIAEIGRADLGLGPLLNATDGGPGGSNPGPVARRELSARMSIACKGRKGSRHSAATRALIGQKVHAAAMRRRQRGGNFPPLDYRTSSN